MTIASLVIIRRGDKVLLGYKKKGGLGSKTINAPGGKLEKGESITRCAVREVLEEVRVVLNEARLEEVAIITFHAAGKPDFQVHVFWTDVFWGEPVETEYMIPGWCSVSNLPLGKMLESDSKWFARAVSREKFRARVYYREQAKGFERIEFLPY